MAKRASDLQQTDSQLVQRFRRGEIPAFEQLVSRYSARVFSLARRLTKSEEDAEEVLQDVFVTVFRKLRGFQGKSTFSSWLYRITVNASFMKLRSRRRKYHLGLEDVGPEVERAIVSRSVARDEAEQIAARAQLCDLLEQAIQKLPDEYRPVFVLRDIDGLTSQEVGKILQISVPAVKSRLHRSRLMLRKRLAAYYREIHSDQPPSRAGNL